MGDNPANIDLTPLLEDRRFRTAYLHYLQLANTYIAQIFFETISRGQNAGKLYTWLENNRYKNWNKASISKPMLMAIVPGGNTKKRHGYLDCYDLDFAKMLENINRASSGVEGIGRRFFYNLSLYHCIARGEAAFLSDLEALRNKRNNIMHKTTPPPDTPVIHALGALLLPKLHQHFLGEIRAANARAKRQGKNVFVEAGPVELAFKTARTARAEKTKDVFGSKTRPGYAGTDKKSHKKLKDQRKRRQDREMAKQAFMRQYQTLYPQGAWPRYNFHGFRIRKSFIGNKNLRAIQAVLKTPKEKIHFSRDIEPVYNTAMKINSELVKLFLVMQQADKQACKAVRDGLQAKTKNELADLCADHRIDSKKTRQDLVDMLVKLRLKGSKDKNQQSRLQREFEQKSTSELEQLCLDQAQGIDKKRAKLLDELAVSIVSKYGCMQGDLRKLSDAIRHNTLFFMIPHADSGKTIPVSEVFRLAFSGLAKPHVSTYVKNPLEQLETCCASILNTLKREDYDWVFPKIVTAENPHPPPLVIRKWHKTHRQKYLDFKKYRLDRRQYVRSVFTRWANSLRKARQQARREIKTNKKRTKP